MEANEIPAHSVIISLELSDPDPDSGKIHCYGRITCVPRKEAAQNPEQLTFKFTTDDLDVNEIVTQIAGRLREAGIGN